ncbi:MAG: HAD family phosphatase [Lachnospiraceae bacterium]|nr:HAD family phosphatase [Lachnospiraceae bacterium]
MLRGILFDMDGTLIDSEPVHCRAYQMTLAPMGFSIQYEDFASLLGATRPVILAKIHEMFGMFPISDEEFERTVQMRKDEINQNEGYPLVAGVREMLERMQKAGYRLAVASSSPQPYIENVITTLSLGGFFDLLISGENVANPKPAPDIFQKAAEKLGLTPSECLVVEDSHNGILAANRAGMASVAFLNPHSAGQDVSTATGFIKDFTEFTPARAEAIWKNYIW